MEERVILHCDLNNFYASVECLKNPEYKDKALAVTGNPKKRTGIILAKSTIAKKMGIKTGMAIWEAKQLCPNLICVLPDFETYGKISKQVHEIYLKYTDKVEPFGIDECWLDVTNSTKLFGSGYNIANLIKEDVKSTLGLTISVGVSFSKMFAKLGSKLADNDEINLITKFDYKQKVWPLPVEKLIFVGRKRLIQLKKMNILTIGNLATINPLVMQQKFGVNGVYLTQIASGTEPDEVSYYNNLKQIKSIGNGTTAIIDVTTEFQAQQLIFYLCDMIAKRMREKGFNALSIHISIKDNLFNHFGKSFTFTSPTNNASTLAKYALKLFNLLWNFKTNSNLIRAIRISVSNLVTDTNFSYQASLFQNSELSNKRTKTEQTLDKIKDKYGSNKIKRALLLNAYHINCEVTDDFFEIEE